MSKTYSISELASEFDVTTRSIRFYEDQKLLHPTRRGQTRIYSSQDRVRLKLTLRGKRLGFSLAEIRELFELWDETRSGSEKQLQLMLSKISERKAALEQQMKDITMVQLELESAEIRCRQALEELNEKHPATTK
ncbi:MULTISPECIES: MerR family transcriptional regulator [Halomonadaceae]|jgi:DNA-binding transcriptional MerR regulator|uniref:MerR family transcriptional regulator n=1 Tax=Vreelandella aquamarina TaxID=77097 RepID=A0A0D7V0I4_9GAMM|nr:MULTISPECIES: MerR family DNA-binding transcriptional regulator [Halomonas]KTG25465.1 MerR family transcriptional regulator [Idiomarina sp. H105]MEC9021000.1 MerR family DNA-binding transcriptional regulator [Pseudomonadota bacterium]OAE96091.1 MerR family transcriptional regulator [Idiomarina sp. WRN-38]KJD20414.1 MerR family transcriptional regulator [Halomonas meridiana]MCC4290024.1 MerR family DNA-binding transcriptional regulator [Halomonas axialensis]